MFPKILGIDAYMFMAVIGFIAGFGLGWIRRKKYGYKPADLALMFCVIIIGLIIGARTLFSLTALPTLINHKFAWEVIEARVVNAGFVFYGGLIGSLLAIYILSKCTKQDTRKLLNFVVPTFAFFHAFGRIGCLLDGCCYGLESSWGITLAGETVKRIPVQLFEAIGLFIITAILLLLESDYMSRGKSVALTPIYLALYAPLRFMLEMYRGDILRGVFKINTSYDTVYDQKVESLSWSIDLSTSQIISLLIMLALLIYVWHNFMVKRREKQLANPNTADIAEMEILSEDDVDGENADSEK